MKLKFNNKLFFISIFLIFLCCIMSVSANENVFDDPQNVTLENDENNEVISVSQDSTLKD